MQTFVDRRKASGSRPHKKGILVMLKGGWDDLRMTGIGGIENLGHL